jgi:altronate dehydratase small subunit
MIDALVLDASDNVATVLRDLPAGATIAPQGPGAALPALATIEPVSAGHKVALRLIAAGDPVRKYGETIGIATATIAAGAHVHVHNVRSRRAQRDRLAGR